MSSEEEAENQHHHFVQQQPSEQATEEQDHYDYQQQQAAPAITPVQRPALVGSLLCLLLPALLLCSCLCPLSLLLSLLPITLLVGLPLWISSTLVLCVSLAWIPYLLFAQEDRPAAAHHSHPLLPLSPLKILRIIQTLIRHAIIGLRSNWLELILDYSYRKIIVLGRNNHSSSSSRPSSRPSIVCRDLLYAYSDHHQGRKKNQRLDVYLPPSFSPPPQQSSSPLAPVFLFIHPGGWRWFDKSLFLQIGLRFRRLGFCVVIPDFTQFPDGRCQQSVRDIRCALRWVASSISEYGGDPARIFVAGHGSGAHLSLLTVLQSAIKRSLEAHRASTSPTEGFLQEEEDVPRIEGMILLSGIYDPINQLREEARVGWLDILASRRALGPSHATILANSPAHLLHHAHAFLLPRYLPAKFLIIHGGEDKNVPILQSHFLSTLLETLNIDGLAADEPPSSDSSSSSSSSLRESYNKDRGRGGGRIQVTFTPLKELDHLGALFALMIGDLAATPSLAHPSFKPRLGYSKIIVDQIRQLVA